MEIALKSFIFIYKPGAAWLEGKPVSEQPLQEHVKFLQGLYQSGVLRFSGPFEDDAGGAAVIEVSDESEAKNLVDRDPAVTNGVLVYELHPWRLISWENFLQN